jgi:hypothetical protein
MAIHGFTDGSAEAIHWGGFQPAGTGQEKGWKCLHAFPARSLYNS